MSLSTVLAGRLGGTRPRLKPVNHDAKGLDTLRNVTTTGGELNAPLFTSLTRRIPAIQRLHGSTFDSEAFARNSVSLLREPLGHPQQRAAAFAYSLGSLFELNTHNFLSNELALAYTKIEQLPDGTERLAWAMPTEEFPLRFEIDVADRTRGSEVDRNGDHWTTYPVGTKLKDIAVTEPTIGCPATN